MMLYIVPQSCRIDEMAADDASQLPMLASG